MTQAATLITSRDNALVKELRRLSQDNTAYRKTGRVWAEGEHLCSAALQRGLQAAVLIYAQSWEDRVPSELRQAAQQVVCVPDGLFTEFSGLESPAGMGLVIDLPGTVISQPGRATVVLDRVQDAGNVGSILRSAAAFGFQQVIALKGTAALWSPKVLRAGMGAHFGLHLIELAELQHVAELQVPLVVTSSHQGVLIQDLNLPHPCAWVMGHEGQGVRPALMELATVHVRIGQPGGEESLNVAAAAAICLHASSLRMA
jgi:RNA methyltransferase, TrmH family